MAGHTATDEVRFFDVDGQLVRILRRLNRPWSFRSMPAFESLALDARDRLWVQEFGGQDDDAGSRWTVYDAWGAPAGLVAMPPRFRPASFGLDHVLGVWENDLDVEYVQRHDLSEGCKTF